MVSQRGLHTHHSLSTRRTRGGCRSHCGALSSTEARPLSANRCVDGMERAPRATQQQRMQPYTSPAGHGYVPASATGARSDHLQGSHGSAYRPPHAATHTSHMQVRCARTTIGRCLTLYDVKKGLSRDCWRVGVGCEREEPFVYHW